MAHLAYRRRHPPGRRAPEEPPSHVLEDTGDAGSGRRRRRQARCALGPPTTASIQSVTSTPITLQKRAQISSITGRPSEAAKARWPDWEDEPGYHVRRRRSPLLIVSASLSLSLYPSPSLPLSLSRSLCLLGPSARVSSSPWGEGLSHLAADAASNAVSLSV